MAKISVLIPVYNVQKYVANTLNSIINQTFKDIEVILVNDGSKDKSEEVIIPYTIKYDYIKYFKKPNTGVADTRNYLLSKAKGEYISFIDSDDEIKETMFEEMYNEALTNNADMVICDYNEVHTNFTILKSGVNLESKVLNSVSLCNKLIKKELFNNNLFPSISLGEDMLVVLNMLVKDIKIAYISKPFYQYYKRDNSLINSKGYKKYWSDIFYVFNELEIILKDYKEELEFLYIQNVLRDSVIRFMYYKKGKNEVDKIIRHTREKYNTFSKNKYYKKQSLRYRIVCFLLYHRCFMLVKIIRKLMNSDR